MIDRPQPPVLTRQSIFQRSHAVHGQPGETRLIPGVNGQSRNSKLVSKSTKTHKRPLEEGAPISLARKLVKQAQDTLPEQHSESSVENEYWCSKKRQRSSIADKDDASNKRWRHDSTNHDEGTAPAVAKDFMQDLLENPSLNELIMTRCNQNRSVSVCSEVAEQDQMIGTPGFALPNSIPSEVRYRMMNLSNIIFSTSRHRSSHYRIDWRWQGYAS